MLMDKIYICGHRHPDTDSIVSSIAYAYLKREKVVLLFLSILKVSGLPCS